MSRFWEEVWEYTLIELCLSDYSALKKLLPGAIERPVEEGEECNSFFAKDLLVEIRDGSRDVHSLEDGINLCHFDI
jgi:predicted DNA-binding protein